MKYLNFNEFHKINEKYTDISDEKELLDYINNTKYSYPKFNFGDNVRLNPDILEIDKLIITNNKYYNWVIDNLNTNFIINKLSHSDSDYNVGDWYYRVNELYWVKECNLIPNMPIYKSKKVFRTLEKNNDSNNSTEICVHVSNMDEYEHILFILKLNDYTISNFYENYIINHNKFYFFINVVDKYIQYAINLDDNYLSNDKKMSDYDLFNNVWDKILTFNNIKLIEKIISTGKIEQIPSYKSKKIERLLEEQVFSVEPDFRVWCNTTENAIEFEKFLFEKGWNWSLYYDMSRHIPTAPSTFIFNIENKKIDSYEQSVCVDDGKIIYTYPEDYQIIYNKLNISPNYKPKNKSKRIIESTSYKKYRVKTKSEFEQEYGDNWRTCQVGTTFVEDMDYLLGTELDIKIKDSDNDITVPRSIGRGYWHLTHKHITLISPNYKPKNKPQRIIESWNSSTDAKEICIHLKNKDEFDILSKSISKYYDIPIYMGSNINSDGIYIFINFIDDDVTQADLSNFPDWVDYDSFDYVWEKILTIDDLQLINNILRYKKVNFSPVYNSVRSDRKI